MSHIAHTRFQAFPFLLFIFSLVVISSIALVAWQLWGGLTEHSTQLYTRYTARLSFVFFLPVFTVQALHTLARSEVTSYLMKKRRAMGLAFALAHGVHLVAIIVYFRTHSEWFTVDDIPALAIYFFIGLMAITSNSLSIRTLKKGWKVIHWIGLYGIFTGFFVTYLGRVQSHGSVSIDPVLIESYWVYVLLLALVSLAWLLRIAAFWKTRYS